MLTRNTSLLLSAAAILAAAMLVGCRNDDPEPVTVQTMETGITAGKLAGMPESARTQVMADMDSMPGYSVSSYEERVTAEGILYDVTYFDGRGGTESRTYNRNGTRVVLPGERSAAQAATRSSEPIQQRASDSTLPLESDTNDMDDMRDTPPQNDVPPRGLGTGVGGGGNLPQ